MQVATARDLLLGLRWNTDQLALARITYLHRGAPGDLSVVDGRRVVRLGRSFFDLADGGSIPYHRVRRIEVGGDVVWVRAGGTRAP